MESVKIFERHRRTIKNSNAWNFKPRKNLNDAKS